MIIIFAPVFDVNGYVVIDNEEPGALGEVTRRVSRVATLDGGAAINDFGYSDGDRTLEITWPLAGLDEYRNLVRMTKSYNRIGLSTADGVFWGTASSLSEDGESATLNVLVEKRIDL